MREIHYLTSSSIPMDLSLPPPYPVSTTTPATTTNAHPMPRPSSSSGSRRSSHKRRPCQLCHYGQNAESQQPQPQHHPPRRLHFPVIPFLIHKNRPHHVRICPCPQKVHLNCLALEGQHRDTITCSICDYAYHSRLRVYLSRAVCFAIHLLSMASVVGLVFGLAQLGSALDKLGLGNEAGSKLDGDELWQDHELQEILAWLQLVHFATGVAGEALLGLVYLVGVCGVIGLDRTLHMLDDIIHINLEPLLRLPIPEWIRRALLCTCLTFIGLILGTYLLFYSWIWACLLCHFCYRILNVSTYTPSPPSSSQ